MRSPARETCIEHCEKFEPIVKGPLWAVAALAPLCAAAAACLAWRVVRGALSTPCPARLKRMSGQTSQFDILVIGSGPSGSHAAQEAVSSGCKVALLDIGYTDTSLERRIPCKSFSEIRRTDTNQHLYFLGDDPATVLRNQDRAGPHLTPARQHMIRNMDWLFPIQAETFVPLQSSGLGGLGISPGGQLFRVRRLRTREDRHPRGGHQAVLRKRRLGSGHQRTHHDCLAPLIANLDSAAIQPPLPWIRTRNPFSGGIAASISVTSSAVST